MNYRRIAVAFLVIVVAGAAIAAGLIWWASGDRRPFAPEEECVGTADGQRVEIDLEQARHTSTIAAIATQRGLPARAVSIALATAYQESDLYNIDYGDRDSVGLFQQRPSQGWGEPEQLLDTVYATNAFYDALVKISNYRDLPITEAAQAVQRSAFPDAYADHEADARILASALSGNSPAAFYCQYNGREFKQQTFGDDGLTKRARKLNNALTGAFGDLVLTGFEPGGIDSGHIPGSAHYDGRAVDVMFEPYDSADQNRRGWALAQWTAANAKRLGVATIIYDDMIWTARRDDEGWRKYVHPSGDTENITLQHLDHVHIDVVRGT